MSESNEKFGMGFVCANAAIATAAAGLLPVAAVFGGVAWWLFKSQKEDDDYMLWKERSARDQEISRQEHAARNAFLTILCESSARYLEGNTTLEEREAELAGIARAIAVYTPGVPVVRCEDWGNGTTNLGDFWTFITCDEAPFLGVSFVDLWSCEFKMAAFETAADDAVEQAAQKGTPLSLYDAVFLAISDMRAAGWDLERTGED